MYSFGLYNSIACTNFIASSPGPADPFPGFQCHMFFRVCNIEKLGMGLLGGEATNFMLILSHAERSVRLASGDSCIGDHRSGYLDTCSGLGHTSAEIGPITGVRS